LPSVELPPLCGICENSPLLELFRATDGNFHTTDESFLIARCPRCGVAQTVPRPPAEQMGRYYPPAYYPTADLDARQYDRRIGRYQRPKVAHLRRHLRAGRVLDVGCGVGYFLHEAARGGYGTKGIEFSREAAEIGRMRFGLDIVTGDVVSAALPEGSFDAVTFWQSLEHLHAPADALKEAHRLLAGGGVLAVGVPNFGSIQAGFFGPRWYHLEVPRHLYHFDPASLTGLVTACGFRVVDVCFGSAEHDWAGILGSLTPLSPPGESFARRVVRKAAGAPISRSVAFIESSLHRGATFELFAVKS
jgi:SAM-dependent methyltransferase